MGEDMDYLLEINDILSRLKEVRRTGWVERGVEDPESVADHSFNVVALSIILADARGLDVAEVARMAILHDLPEAVIGDLTPSQKREKLSELGRIEDEIIKSLAGLMPREVGDKYLQAWRKLVEGRSPEAKLVRLVDKLEMGLQATRYIKKGGDNKLLEIYYSGIDSVKEDPCLLEILKKALER
ncbi:MAG: HD family hydrolase [Nitrososphaerota archaeon]